VPAVNIKWRAPDKGGIFKDIIVKAKEDNDGDPNSPIYFGVVRDKHIPVFNLNNPDKRSDCRRKTNLESSV
jgi:hypothetical protein